MHQEGATQPGTMALNVGYYYKQFASIFGAVTTTISSLPLVSALLPEHWSSYIFPPLGPAEIFIRLATVVLAGLVTLVVYFTKDSAFVTSRKGRVKFLLLAFFTCVIGACAFFILSLLFVRQIEIPAQNTTIVVSVGFERTDEAKKKFDEKADWEMLIGKGPYEQSIHELWTVRSILISRSLLLLSYLMFLLPAVATGSLGVLYDTSGPATQP